MYFGDYAVNSLIDIPWGSQDQTGGSIDPSTPGTLRIYKDASTTQRASASGITDTRDFAGITGVHHVHIDTSDNTDPGFWAAGHEYKIMLIGAVIDTKTVNTTLAVFSIERAGAALAVAKTLPVLATLTAGVWSTVVETQGQITAKQALDTILAICSGVTSGGGLTFMSPNGVATRVVVTTDASNDRLVITLTPSA